MNGLNACKEENLSAIDYGPKNLSANVVSSLKTHRPSTMDHRQRNLTASKASGLSSDNEAVWHLKAVW